MDTTDRPSYLLHVLVCPCSGMTLAWLFPSKRYCSRQSEFLFFPLKRSHLRASSTLTPLLRNISIRDPESLWRCGRAPVPAAWFVWSSWLQRCWFHPQKVPLTIILESFPLTYLTLGRNKRIRSDTETCWNSKVLWRTYLSCLLTPLPSEPGVM